MHTDSLETAFGDFMRAFDAFKETNDRRLSEIERCMAADPVTEEKLARIWRRSIMPYLKEYYFDQPERANKWAWDGEIVSGIRNSRGN